MSGFLSSFFRQSHRPNDAGDKDSESESYGAPGRSSSGDKDSEAESYGAPGRSSSGAASWVTMTQPAAGKGEPVMHVSEDTVAEVFEPLGGDDPVNVIAIFGAARGGKSFLMNQLAGKDDIFKISNDKDPCTQGIDVSRAIVSLKDFAAMNGCTAPPVVSGSKVRVCFVDVEGQGDRDVTYDARLASAILPLTKCVIFNWRDSLQVDRILNLLGVMQRAAHNVDLAGEDGSGSAGPKFGHLHVVFRDWNYSGTAEQVKKQLFGLDKRGMGVEVAMKNELRRTIMAAFASVTVWLFPAPVEMTSELSKELKSEDLSPGFQSELAGLRSALSSQLAEPMTFGLANPITGYSLGSLVPSMVDVLNTGDIIMPESAYQQMLDKEAERLKKTYLEKADALIETGMRACEMGPPVPQDEMEVDMEEAIQNLLNEFKSEAKEIGAKDEVVDQSAKEIRIAVDRGMQGLRAHNGSVLARHLKAAIKEARANFTKEFTQACKALMPLPLSELSAMSSEAASRARARLEAIPPSGPDDDSLQDALSALEDFIELAVSKAERENDAVERAQHKEQEDALDGAIRSFQQELRADLESVRAGGGPYKLASVEAVGEAALASATAKLQRELPKGKGNGVADRVASLVGRLQESARTMMVEEKSAFDRNCSDYMMRLATEERRRLRSETVTDVHPLLPLHTTSELESAFKPVAERMLGRMESAGQGWALSGQARAQYMESAKSDAESVWQSLFERNERIKLQQEHQAVGEDAQRQREEARRLKERLEQERRRVEEAESSARHAAEAAAKARLAATEADQRTRQAVGEKERAAAAREKEKMKEELKRAEERERAAAQAAKLAAAVRAADQERMAAEAKAAEAKAAEARASEARVTEAKAAAAKAAEARAAEARALAAEAKADEARAAKARAEEARAEEARAAEASAAEASAAEARARVAEAKAAEARAAEARAEEARVKDARAAEARASAAEARAAEAKAAEARAEEARVAEARAAEARARAAEARAAEARAAEARAAEARAAEARAAEAKAAEARAEEARVAEARARAAEARAAEARAEEARAAEAKAAEARAEDARALEQQNEREELFEDAMSEEEENEEAMTGKRRNRRTKEETEKWGQEGEEDEPKRKVTRRSGRRETIMTPVGKDPAALKKAREEAAKQIKNREDAKIGKDATGEAEEDKYAGLSAVEKSRRRAKEWAEKEKVRKEALAKKRRQATAAAAGTSSSGTRPSANRKKSSTSGKTKK